jgi:hypothetical protein
MHKMSQFQSVESIKDMMGDLQTQNRMLIETNGRLSSEMKGTLRMVSSLEAKLREESEKRAAADIETVKFKDIVRQKDVNNVVLKKEIEGLQSLLDSYTTDPMVTGDMTEALSQKEAHIKVRLGIASRRETKKNLLLPYPLHTGAYDSTTSAGSPHRESEPGASWNA